MSGEWHGGKKDRGYRDEDDYKPPRISPHEEAWVAFENTVCIRESRSTTSLLMVLDSGEEDVWFPKNQISDDHSEVWQVGQEGTLVVSAWIADVRRKEGKLTVEGDEVS